MIVRATGLDFILGSINDEQPVGICQWDLRRAYNLATLTQNGQSIQFD
jgi:hypothetical protein